MRSVKSSRSVRRQSNLPPPAKAKFKLRYIAGVGLAAVLVLSVFSFAKGAAVSEVSAISSGVPQACLDVVHDSTAPNSRVQLWSCNKSAAQNWTVKSDRIIHDVDHCLSVQADAKQVGSPVVLTNCTPAPGQLWLRDGSGYYNPNSQLCLMAVTAKTGSPLIIASCKNLSSVSKTWQPQIPPTGCASTKGQRIACVAETEWSSWQTSTNHLALLDKYTGNAPYEAWCADFVSYVYRQAGYAFTNGSNNGWDENIAENIQNLGFSKHYVGSGYEPQAGDVAYFDYAGGHVELVLSGGKTPTFVYGNSGWTDPTTGNGDMAANTITNDSNGKVVYYLSPSL